MACCRVIIGLPNYILNVVAAVYLRKRFLSAPPPLKRLALLAAGKSGKTSSSGKSAQ
jgi:hypothetical protein